MFSIPHMIVIFVVVLVVFGPKKLPELARGLGKLMAEFRKASTDFRSAFEQEMRDIERQALQAERKKQAESAAKAASEAGQPVTQASAAGSESPVADAQEGTRLTEGDSRLEPVIAPVPEAIPRGGDDQESVAPQTNGTGTIASTRGSADDRRQPPESAKDTEASSHDLHEHDLHRPA